MKDKLIIGNEKNILFYNDENGNTKVEVLLENEDVWLNTEALASLFNIDRSGILDRCSILGAGLDSRSGSSFTEACFFRFGL